MKHLKPDSLDIAYERSRYECMTSHDRQIYADIIAEVSALGYNVSYYCEVLYVKDSRLIPIFQKRIYAFDDRGINKSLISYFGFWKFSCATRYCIDQFLAAEPTQMPGEGECIEVTLKHWWAQSIAWIKDKRYIKDYLAIVADIKNIMDCGPIMEVLAKLKIKEAIPVLLSYYDLENDKYLANANIVVAMGNYGDPAYLPYITPFLNSHRTVLRQHAKEALAKIEKSRKNGHREEHS